MQNPPNCSQKGNSSQNDAVVVHGGDLDWERRWETVHDVEEDYEDEGKAIDNVSSFAQPWKHVSIAFLQHLAHR